MRIIKAICAVIVGLGLIAATIVFIFLQVFDTDVYHAQIIRQASKMIGRPLTIGHLALGVSWEGLTVDVGPVVIDDDPDFTSLPFATIDRVRLNLDTVSLILQHKVHVTHVLLQSPTIHIIRSQEGILNIHSFKVSAAGGALKLAPEQVDSKITAQVGQSLGMRPSEISLQSISLRDGSVSFIDQSQSFPLDIWVSDINAGIHGFSLTKPFHVRLKASALSTTSNLHLRAKLSFNNAALMANDLDFYTNLAKLDPVQVKNVSPMLAKTSLPPHWSGSLSIHLNNLNMGGAKAWQAHGQVNLSNLVIENFDLGEMIFSRTLGSYADIFASKLHLISWPLNGLCSFVLEGQDVLINEALVRTKDFDFTAKGLMDENRNASFQTVLSLSPEASLALAGQIKMVEYLLDDHKQLVIPAEVKGVFPHLEYKLGKDFRKKIKKAFKKEGAGAVISDVLNSFLR